MIPHVFGWFPMTAAWVVMIHHLEQARYDLSLVTEQTIPEWVDGAIYGTVLIFWSFTIIQIVFQREFGFQPNPPLLSFTCASRVAQVCHLVSTGAPQ